MTRAKAWRKYEKSLRLNKPKGYGVPYHGKKQYRKSRYIKARKRFAKRVYHYMWSDTDLAFDNLYYVMENLWEI